MAKNDFVKISKELVEELLKKLEIEASVRASINEDKEEKELKINLQSEGDIGLLIGKHGETLASLEKFVLMGKMMITTIKSIVLIVIADLTSFAEALI